MTLFIFAEDPEENVDLAHQQRYWSRWFGPNVYSYHDTPDGHDMFKKLGCLTRDVGCLSTAVGFIYGKEALHNRSNLVALAETFRVAYPPVLAAATFALVSNSLAKYEKKSGHHNYAISGFAAGCVWSLGYKHDFYTGLGRGLITAAFAALYYQVRVVEGRKFVPDEFKTNIRDYGYPRSREFFNWSLSDDVPKRDW